MKVILSRKGFDSESGGYPSPILPNGQMVSLPIPQYDGIKYSDVLIGDSTYYDLMKALEIKKIKDVGDKIALNKNTKCHLDPDIYKKCYNRKPNWRPLFGPSGVAQGHLQNQHVGKNDLFLFFGLLKIPSQTMVNLNLTHMNEKFTRSLVIFR